MYSLVIASVLIKAILCDELLSVVVMYRHGDRTPIKPYPTDPYRNNSYWPVGFGQLTNLGKMQHYLLGRWLRDRYSDFLPSHYSEKDFYIRSTDVDRTLMSAESNLAGLYPPKKDQIWDPSIPWQPIPIHTIPELEDNLLGMKKPCPQYDILLKELFETEYFVNISRQNRDLYAYLSNYTGAEVDNLEALEYIYSTLAIEKLYNFTLPQWTRAVFPDRMRHWAELSFATPTWTQPLARFKTGTIFNEIVRFFANVTLAEHRKFLVFSAHDITISNVLNAMGAFSPHAPPYASTVIFELRNSSPPFVNIFYRNSSQVQNITLQGCDFNCRFEDFLRLLSPLVMSREQWDEECKPSVVFYLVRDTLSNIRITLFVISVIVLSAVSLTFCCRRNRIRPSTTYTQLPCDEVTEAMDT